MHTLADQPLTRSPNAVLGGVAAGLAQRFGIDAMVVRLLWLASFLVFGTGLLFYLLLWWLMPVAGNLPVERTIWRLDRDGRRRPPLVRARHDRRLLGVCGGLAQRWQTDPTIVRLGAVGLLAVAGPVAVALYLVVALVVPDAEPDALHSGL